MGNIHHPAQNPVANNTISAAASAYLLRRGRDAPGRRWQQQLLGMETSGRRAFAEVACIGVVRLYGARVGVSTTP